MVLEDLGARIRTEWPKFTRFHTILCVFSCLVLIIFAKYKSFWHWIHVSTVFECIIHSNARSKIVLNVHFRIRHTVWAILNELKGVPTIFLSLLGSSWKLSFRLILICWFQKSNLFGASASRCGVKRSALYTVKTSDKNIPHFLTIRGPKRGEPWRKII